MQVVRGRQNLGGLCSGIYAAGRSHGGGDASKPCGRLFAKGQEATQPKEPGVDNDSGRRFAIGQEAMQLQYLGAECDRVDMAILSENLAKCSNQRTWRVPSM